MRKYTLSLAAIIAAVHCNAGTSQIGDKRGELFCDELCSCEGCTDSDRAVCVSDMNDLISEAETSHCDDELNSYFSCLGKDAFCDTGTYDTSACHTEENVLQGCISGASGSGGAGGAGGSTGTGATCPTASNGVCDEPEGTNTCAEGTDAADCGGACGKCSSVLTGASPAALCAASQPILSSLQMCGCGVCAAQCPSLCINQPDTTTCFMCLQSVCSTQYTTCQNDF